VGAVIEPRTDSENADGEGNRTVITISKEAWASAKQAIHDSTHMPEGSTQEELMAYHKLLYQKHQALRKIQADLVERKQHTNE
jgi:hypothetical protein